MKKRAWDQYVPRFFERLNWLSGIGGVGGAAVGISGWAPLSAVATPLIAVGGAVSVITVAYALVKAVPPAQVIAEDLIGQDVSLDVLSALAVPPLKVAIIGLSQAGKTTLKLRLTHDEPLNQRTQNASAFITALPTSTKLIALLDGGGEIWHQQFNIAAKADILFIVVDHNSSDSSFALDRLRLKEHKDFLNQVRHHLDGLDIRNMKAITLLVNKSDLWMQGNATDVADIRQFGEDEIQKWRGANRATAISLRHHSNESPNEIAAILKIVKSSS